MNSLIAQIIAVLISIETGGHPNPDTAIGDNGAAIGVLQIHKIYVDEANRIERRLNPDNPRTWSYEDRTNRLASIEMVEITLTWHYLRGVTDPVALALRHNRPNGNDNPAYRRKLEEKLCKHLTHPL